MNMHISTRGSRLSAAARPGATESVAISELSLHDKEFLRLSSFIYDHCGIKMSSSKKTMLETRLRKRLRALGFENFSDYCDFLFSSQGNEQELTAMINVVTTNKTDFFREPAHFEYLINHAAPQLFNRISFGGSRELRVWSAGCSSGEEPYTLAMLLHQHVTKCSGIRFSILATDISTTVLDKAKLAIYEEERIAPVPAELRRNFFLRSRDRKKGLVRVAPEIRSSVNFRRLNFMDDTFDIPEQMDIVFCRNVIIYFDRATQECLLNKLCKYLIPGGYLFLGHSESLNGLDVPVNQVTSTIYQKPL